PGIGWTIAVFQAVDQIPGRAGKGGGGTRAIEHRRISDRFGTERAGPEIISERATKSRTPRRLEKGSCAPACRAQDILFRSRMSASDAGRRQQQVEERTQACRCDRPAPVCDCEKAAGPPR